MDESIEGVIVVSPAESHYEIAKEALLAGKDVFVEKPLALRVREGGKVLHLGRQRLEDIFIHETSCVDEPSEIGEGTRIWHYCHIMEGAAIGRNCSIG